MRTACQPNHAAAMPKTAAHAPLGSTLSRGTSIPAIAAPMAACNASVSSSVARRRRREMARRLTE